MDESAFDVVTGAFSYTGRAIARYLIARGRRVRTLTGHPRSDPELPEVEASPYRFDDPAALAAALRGAEVLYNTYWVRFPRAPVSFEGAVENSRVLFRAASAAGIRKIVHVSVTKPSLDSRWPYFRGKALVEASLRDSGVPFAVVRPRVVFGEGDILINNIAWLLRRFPVFCIPGQGDYRVRPVHADDVASVCTEAAAGPSGVTTDAVGPETLTFEEMVGAVRAAVGVRTRLVHVPPSLIPALTRLIGLAVRDVLLTPHELGGLMAELSMTEGPSTGAIRFSEWVAQHGRRLGMRYASELKRHFAPDA